MSSYSVVEGDTVTVCASVLCGRLLRNETVMLSITDGTARGYCMKILHEANESLLYLFVYSWDGF
jgi:hypothetical protein